MVAIVLTGTIVPNAVKTQHTDWKARRAEYLSAIGYYRGFARVYFLENSRYDVEGDPDFSRDDRLTIVKHLPSDAFDRGKGYQEFQMLDHFAASQPPDSGFLKITGRYRYRNFAQIYRSIQRNATKLAFIIDANRRVQMARTDLFYFNVGAYTQHVSGSYVRMDDLRNRYAEHIIYEQLAGIESYCFFERTPLIQAKSGSTGQMLEYTSHWKTVVRNVQRMTFRAIGRRELLV